MKEWAVSLAYVLQRYMMSQQGHFISLYELSVWPNPCLMKLPALLLPLFLFVLYNTLHYVCHSPVSVSWSSVRFLGGFLKGADTLCAGFMHLSFTCVVRVLEASALMWSLKVFIYPLQELIWKQHLSLEGGWGNRSLSTLWKSAGSHSRCHQSVSPFSTKGRP